MQSRLREGLEGSGAVSEANTEHYRDNRAEIREKYGGKYVAVIDREVVPSSSPPDGFTDARQFVDELEEEYGEHRVQSAYITFVPPK